MSCDILNESTEKEIDFNVSKIRMSKQSAPHNICKFTMQSEAIEWSARTRKYKCELVHTAQKVYLIRKEINILRSKFENDEDEYIKFQNKSDESRLLAEELHQKIKEELNNKDQIVREINLTKRNLKRLLHEKKTLAESCLDKKMKIKSLEAEVEQNRLKWQEASFEKIKLNLQTDNLLKERMQLEDITREDQGNTEILKREIDDIRNSLQVAWIETKRVDMCRNVKGKKLQERFNGRNRSPIGPFASSREKEYCRLRTFR